MHQLSSIEHHIRDLLCATQSINSKFVNQTERDHSEYESYCIEIETNITWKRLENAYEL